MKGITPTKLVALLTLAMSSLSLAPAMAGATAPVATLADHERVSARELAAARFDKPDGGIAVLDVRPRTEYEICNLEGSVNIPSLKHLQPTVKINHPSSSQSWHLIYVDLQAVLLTFN